MKWETKTVPLSPGMGGLWELPAVQGQLEKSRISICRVDPGFLTTPRLLWSSLFGGSSWPLVLHWIWSLTVLWVHFKSRIPGFLSEDPGKQHPIAVVNRDHLPPPFIYILYRLIFCILFICLQPPGSCVFSHFVLL